MHPADSDYLETPTVGNDGEAIVTLLCVKEIPGFQHPMFLNGTISLRRQRFCKPEKLVKICLRAFCESRIAGSSL